MKKLHIIYIPFTGVGLRGGYRGSKWFEHRVSVFRRFTLRSLANQANRNFTLWVSFRPEEEKNILTGQIAKAIEDAGLDYIFTYDGLLYHDDKFTDFNTKTRVKNFVRMIWDMWYYKEWKNPFEIIKYTWENKNETLPKRLEKSLEKLRAKFKDWHKTDWVYLTRLDSDDMFHQDFVEHSGVVENGSDRIQRQRGPSRIDASKPFHPRLERGHVLGVFPADLVDIRRISPSKSDFIDSRTFQFL